MTRKKNNSASASAAAKDVSFDFAVEFRKFLTDDANKALLQDTISGPLVEEIRDLKRNLADRDCHIESLEKKVATLQEKNDQLEQYSRRNSVRVAGIAEEDREDATQKVLDVLNNHMSLDPPLTLEHVDRAHRTGAPNPGRPRAILLKLTSYRQKQRIMSNRFSLFNTQPSISVNEDLTRPRATLLWHARRAKKQGRILDCWTMDGRVMIKDCHESKHRIANALDLEGHFSHVNPPNSVNSDPGNQPTPNPPVLEPRPN